ncbi:MAG: DUF2834 domain-containing protein [Thainema sp.]
MRFLQGIQQSGRNVMISLIWLWFTVYIIWLAPLDQPETLPIVSRLLTFQVTEVNAYLFAVFWLMGVWPMIYASLMFIDCREQRLPSWLYFIASNATGIVGLVPYLIFRDRNQEFHQQMYEHQSQWIKRLESRNTAIILVVATIGLLATAWLLGDWSDFVEQWRAVPFIHLITIDFCLMTLLFPLTPLLDDDMARRGVKDRRVFWAVALVPLFGPLAYLCLRPRLIEIEIE